MKDYTDAQLVARAYKLLNADNLKEKLPPNHTLIHLWQASKLLRETGVAFVDEQGERLKALDRMAYTALAQWRELSI